MKTLNIIIALILFATLAFSQTAQCNLNIDEINTKVYTRDNNYVYKSLVRHTPPRGNDDDAHNVTIQIIIPPNSTFLPPAKAYMNNGEVGTTSFDGHTVTITGIYIPRDEHVDVEIMVTNPCTQESNSEYSFIITAFPGYPFDIDLSDNQYVYTKLCPKSFVDLSSIPREELPTQKPIYISELCKRAMIDCPGCGINFICLGDIFRIPRYLDIESVELRLGNEILDIKHFRNKKSNVNTKSIDIVLTRSISKKESESLNLLFNRSKIIK